MFTYNKHGGLHFVRVVAFGRAFGFSFYWGANAQRKKFIAFNRAMPREQLRVLSVRMPDGSRVFRVG